MGYGLIYLTLTLTSFVWGLGRSHRTPSMGKLANSSCYVMHTYTLITMKKHYFIASNK